MASPTPSHGRRPRSKAAAPTDRSGRPQDDVLPFDRLDRAALPVAGGKAANLGEMARAGLPVPPGFCVATAAYARVADAAPGLEGVLAALPTVPAGDNARLEALAGQARAALTAAPVPADIAAAIAHASRALGE